MLVYRVFPYLPTAAHSEPGHPPYEHEPDLADADALAERALRPTQIVTRNLAVTQAWGRRVWNERDPHDAHQHRWQAVKWWSYHRPSWSVIAGWKRPEFEGVEDLRLDHPVVRDAAAALSRVPPPS